MTQLFSVAEATIMSRNHPGCAAHAWPKPTIVSRNHPWTRGSRVAEANNREPTIVLGARRPKRPKPTIGKPLSPLERGDPSGRSRQLGSRYLQFCIKFDLNVEIITKYEQPDQK